MAATPVKRRSPPPLLRGRPAAAEAEALRPQMNLKPPSAKGALCGQREQSSVAFAAELNRLNEVVHSKTLWVIERSRMLLMPALTRAPPPHNMRVHRTKPANTHHKRKEARNTHG
jgi:hypothetical protein